MAVDIFRLVFGIYNGLILIKTVISGNSIAYSNRDQIIGNSLKAEKFKGDENRCNRAVGNAAEKSDHSGGSA